MSRKRRDGEEKLRILVWRQENVIMKKCADVLLYNAKTLL